MLFVDSTEYLLEKGLNRLAVLFSGNAPAILEAQTWSHFGLEKKKTHKPLSPLPKCTSCETHPDPILFREFSKDMFDEGLLFVFID